MVFRNYSLTLIDSLDTLAVLGDFENFRRNVDYVIDHVDFDQPYSVNVFEVTIRVLGALLSAHELIVDSRAPSPTFPLGVLILKYLKCGIFPSVSFLSQKTISENSIQ